MALMGQMKLFTDFEFTLVTQRPVAECAEIARQVSLFGELMGNKLKKKDAAIADERHFAYKFRSGLTFFDVTGAITPYEQPYSGCRIDVCLSEGTSNNAMNRFVFYVVMPLFFMACLTQQEFALAGILVALAVFIVCKLLYFDRPNCRRTQELLEQLFHAKTEQPQNVQRDEDA